MIEYRIGDMFRSGADCLVNTVNCEGYMGKGIAYQFKLQFPENNKSYVKACKTGELRVGRIHYFVENGITIINFPTKDKWRENSRLSYIESGLDALLEILPDLHVVSLAIPPLGCGNGGLEWETVKITIQNKLACIENEYEFLIYEPKGNYKQKAATAPKLTAASLVLMTLKMGLKEVSKLRFQKVAYFMNIFSGENYFAFQKHKYGPYAHSIDIISRDIGEYQNYYGLKDTKSTYEMVYQVICSDKTTKVLERLSNGIKKSVEYVNCIDNDHDLEGIATVLYLIETGANQSKERLISDFEGWSEDKAKRFSREEIEQYISYLLDTGVIEKNVMGGFNISQYIKNCCI